MRYFDIESDDLIFRVLPGSEELTEFPDLTKPLHASEAQKKKNIGSSFDGWLREEGIYEEVTPTAIKRVLAREGAAATAIALQGTRDVTPQASAAARSFLSFVASGRRETSAACR